MDWWIAVVGEVDFTYINMVTGLRVYNYKGNTAMNQVKVTRGEDESTFVDAFYGKAADDFMKIFLARAVVFSLTEDGRVVSTVMASDDYKKPEK